MTYRQTFPIHVLVLRVCLGLRLGTSCQHPCDQVVRTTVHNEQPEACVNPDSKALATDCALNQYLYIFTCLLLPVRLHWCFSSVTSHHYKTKVMQGRPRPGRGLVVSQVNRALS